MVIIDSIKGVKKFFPTHAHVELVTIDLVRLVSNYCREAVMRRLARHRGPMCMMTNIKGPTATQRPARRTYVQPTPIAWMMRSMTETHAAPNEHRTRLFCTTERSESCSQLLQLLSNAKQQRTHAVTDPLWSGRRSTKRVCVVFMIIIPV